jgi:drug/metabolite transporter (DMT)-like permease
MKRKINRTSGILILILATAFWGSTFAFTKELTTELTPLWVVAIRFSITALILLAMFFPQVIWVFKSHLKRELPWLALLGLVNFLAIFLQTVSLTEIPASNNGFITSFALLLVPFLEFIFRKKPVHTNIKVAVLVLLVGIYIMSYGFSLPKRVIAGDMIALLSALAYAFYIILVDILSKKVNAGVLMFFVFLVTGIISIPLAFILDGRHSLFTLEALSQLSPSTYFNMGFLIFMGTIIPYVFMGIGQRVTDASTASMIYILEPVFAMMIALLFFGEEPIMVKFVGGGIIMIAQFIGIRKGRRTARNPVKMEVEPLDD